MDGWMDGWMDGESIFCVANELYFTLDKFHFVSKGLTFLAHTSTGHLSELIEWL